MDLASWKSGAQFVELCGHRIFCRDSLSEDTASSQKPALLLIHGFPTSSIDYAPLWARLSDTHRVIAYDMLGFGLSAKPPAGPYTIAMQADIAIALVDRLGLNAIDLIAHDLGDTVAQEILARHQGKQLNFNINRVALLNGGLFPETHHALPIQKLMLSPIGPFLARFNRYNTFRKSLRRICSEHLQEQDIQQAWDLLRLNDGHLRLPQLIRYMVERRQHRERWLQALREHSGPLCVINGSNDPVSGEHMVRRFEELVPGRQAYRLSGLGHYPHLESPATVGAAWGAFLGAPSA